MHGLPDNNYRVIVSWNWSLVLPGEVLRLRHSIQCTRDMLYNVQPTEAAVSYAKMLKNACCYSNHDPYAPNVAKDERATPTRPGEVKKTTPGRNKSDALDVPKVSFGVGSGGDPHTSRVA